jgi:hypothetical protein
MCETSSSIISTYFERGARRRDPGIPALHPDQLALIFSGGLQWTMRKGHGAECTRKEIHK